MAYFFSNDRRQLFLAMGDSNFRRGFFYTGVFQPSGQTMQQRCQQMRQQRHLPNFCIGGLDTAGLLQRVMAAEYDLRDLPVVINIGLNDVVRLPADASEEQEVAAGDAFFRNLLAICMRLVGLGCPAIYIIHVTPIGPEIPVGAQVQEKLPIRKLGVIDGFNELIRKVKDVVEAAGFQRMVICKLDLKFKGRNADVRHLVKSQYLEREITIGGHTRPDFIHWNRNGQEMLHAQLQLKLNKYEP